MTDQPYQSKPKSDSQAIRQEVENEFELEHQEELDLEVLEQLDDEVGLQRVDLDPAAIDAISNNESTDLDADEDGIVDAVTPSETISDLPQDVTESYGTGLQGQPSDRAGTYSRRSEHILNQPNPGLSGGDVDASDEDAETVGEEGVGGTAATPDQDVVDELAAAVGIEIDDRSFLRTNDMLEERDDRRWELDPKSSEDYSNRRD